MPTAVQEPMSTPCKKGHLGLTLLTWTLRGQSACPRSLSLGAEVWLSDSEAGVFIYRHTHHLFSGCLLWG
jgi:hypothetical protein